MSTGDNIIPIPSADARPAAEIRTTLEAVPAPAEGKSPTPADLLSWCAAARPALWFPSDQAARSGIPRADFDEPLWLLRQAGLIKVGDWVRGRGQGFVLTAAGEEALANPNLLATATSLLPAAQSPRTAQTGPDADTALPGLLKKASGYLKSSRNAAIPTPFDRGEAARAAVMGPRKMLITTILLGINLAWFLVGLAVAWRMNVSIADYFATPPGDLLVRLGAVSGSRLLADEWWRLLTCCFVHIGGLHLLANMIALLILGPMAEAMWGRWRYLIIYGIAGIAGSSLAMATEPNSILAGASGCIWGLMTAIIVWLLLRRSHLPASLLADRLRSLILVLLVNAALSAAPGLSWQGHLGGGLAGVVAAILLDWVQPGLGWRCYGAMLGLLLYTASAPLAVLVARSRTEPWLQLQRQELVRTMAALEPVAFGHLVPLHREVSISLVRLTPDSVQAARSLIRDWESRLMSAQQGLLGSWPPAVREQNQSYLEAIDRYLAVARDRLGENRRPTEAEWAALNDEFDRVRQQWDAVAQTADQVLGNRPAP